MVSVYLHNNDKSDGDEKEYEKVMFQVEVLIADDLMSPIFVPEYLCRKVELEDVILSILVYTLFSRMFDLMQPPAVKHSIAVV